MSRHHNSKQHYSFTASLGQNLLGCLELALFMNNGKKRFATDGAAFKHSFIIPVISFLIMGIALIFLHPYSSLSSVPSQWVLMADAARIVVYFALFLAVMYGFASRFQRIRHFKRFVIANNWLCIPQMVMMMPLIAMVLAGWHSFDELKPLMVMATFYSYAYSAFMITCVMRVPWEMGAALSIAAFAINQTALDTIRWMADFMS